MSVQKQIRISLRCLATLGMVGLFFSSARAGGAYADAVLADEPIGYWTLDEVGGDGTTAVNLGTLGATANREWVGDDVSGGAGPDLPGFDADNKAMKIEFGVDPISGVTVEEPILDDLRAFTLSGWINPEEHEASARAGLFGQDNAIEFGFIGPSDIHFWAELPDGGDVHINSIYEFDNEEWHHIAVTGDGETGDVFFYVDGEEQELQQNNSMPLDDLGKDSYGISGLPFNIGGGAIFGDDTQYLGSIDEVAAFDKFLTQEQIQAHYQAAISAVGDPCDFDGDGSLGVGDIDLLSAEIQAGTNNAAFDVTGDSMVNLDDLNFFVGDETKLHTFVGDSNLDGEFNSSDLVAVFGVGEYEDATAGNSTWADGDWNGDGDFNSSDLVAAFTDGGYELGPKWTPPAAVPEPASATLLVLGALLLATRRRK